MKLPARLALVASTGILLVAGLTVGTGFASTVRDSGADSVQSINRTTSMLSLEQSRQTNLLGSLGSQGNDIQSNGNLGEAQFVRGRFGGQVVDRPENIQSWLRATLDDSGDITQEKMDHRLDKAEERINAVLNGEGHKRGPHKSGMFRQVTKSVAEALGMEVSDVVALKNEGKTLAQIIADNNGDFDAIVDTLVERLRERLQEKVDSGDITQEKMDHRLDKAEERINAVLNGEHPSRMHKGKDRSRGRTRGGDQSFRPNRGGDTQIDSETTAF